jgi:hypothetical protein
MSVHVQSDAFMAFIANGWVDPSVPEAAHQHHVVGGALAVTAMQFAAGGYTTVVDGHLFPKGVEGFAAASGQRGLALHYVVLRADLDTCLARAGNKSERRWPLDPVPFADTHARFGELGAYETHVVDATGTPDDVAAAVFSAFLAGRTAVTGHAPDRDV